MFGKSLRRDSRPQLKLLQEAIDIANQSDVIVAALGESAEMSGESISRSDIRNSSSTTRFIKSIIKNRVSLLCWYYLPEATGIKMGK